MAKKTTKKAASKSSSSTGSRARTKSEVYGVIADETGLSKKQISQVFDSMRGLIERDLGKKGPGVFTVPGMMKLRAVSKPATKATTRNDPFNPGKMMTVKAKPASRRVRIRPLKALKDAL